MSVSSTSPLSAGLLRFDFVEHRLGSDVLLDLFQLWIVSGRSSLSAINVTSQVSLVSSCSVSSEICRSRSARLSASAALRFWLIRTKVDRKIASTEAAMARITNDGSKVRNPGTSPTLTAIQAP